MSGDHVEIVDYDPRWPGLFAEEAARLRAALDPALVVAIDHFGSTSIPGLAAKPIIDILIVVHSVASGQRELTAPLRGLGYVFWDDNPDKEHLFFVKGMPPFGEGRTHHIHMVEPGSPIAARLLFRDYLRGHPDEATRYAALKRELAERHRDDREAYTGAKGTYVAEIMAKARGEGQDR